MIAEECIEQLEEQVRTLQAQLAEAHKFIEEIEKHKTPPAFVGETNCSVRQY